MIDWRRDYPASFAGAASRYILTPHQRTRLRRTLAKEPDLEAWQIAERFGVTEQQAIDLMHRFRPRSS